MLMLMLFLPFLALARSKSYTQDQNKQKKSEGKELEHFIDIKLLQLNHQITKRYERGVSMLGYGYGEKKVSMLTHGR